LPQANHVGKGPVGAADGGEAGADHAGGSVETAMSAACVVLASWLRL
jgi:hypothetical protein